MARSTRKDAQALLHSLRSAYAATPTNLKIIDLYVIFAVSTALIQLAGVRLTRTRSQRHIKCKEDDGTRNRHGSFFAVRFINAMKLQNLILLYLPWFEPCGSCFKGDECICVFVFMVVYMAIVGSFPFNSFLSGVLSCVGTAVLGVCLRIQVNKENKEFKDLPPERAFADFVLCNLVLHLVIMNFLG